MSEGVEGGIWGPPGSPGDPDLTGILLPWNLPESLVKKTGSVRMKKALDAYRYVSHG